ncbi:MAG TPA: integrase [Solibacterales bacterium]|nr:integrase [Bryobacterales bacterium]
MKAGHPYELLPVAPPRSPRPLEQMRARIRYCDYSLSTERTCLYWTRQFIRFHRLRHPREMGGVEVAAFLTYLASTLKASVSTHRQALSALLFLYRQVLEVERPWMQEIGRPVARPAVPSMARRWNARQPLAACSIA